MFMHNPRTAAAQEMLADAKLFGTPYKVTSAFTVPEARINEHFTANIRMNKELEPLGAVGDLGWYCVRFSLVAFNYDAPTEVSMTCIKELEPLGAVGDLGWYCVR